jgi:dienelactone hydrolase
MAFRRSSSLFLALVVVGTVAVSCGGSDDAGASAPSGPVARFRSTSATSTGASTPDFLDVPFPSDVYLANGKIMELPGFDRVFKRSGEYLTHELSKMDGFSRDALALFYVDDTTAPKDDEGEVAAADLDPKSLPAGENDCIADTSSVFLIDLQAADPSKARVLCRGQVHDDGKALSRTRPMLAIGPARGVVLEEGHQYAAVLTSRVKDKTGRHLVASAELVKLRDEKAGPLAALYGPAFDKVKAAVGAALASDKSEIVAIAPYTTNKMTHELYALRDELEDLPAPTFAWDAAAVLPMSNAKFARAPGASLPAGFTASLDDWLGVVDPQKKLPDGTDDPDAGLAVHAHDSIDAIGTASFMAASWLQDKGGYDTLDHATFKYEGTKIVRSPEHPEVKIWATFAIPRTPMPAEGYPVVILQHGLGGSRDYLLDLANTFCKKGWITVAIDSVTFGGRAPEASYQKDEHSDYEGAPGAKYKGPDGLADVDAVGSRNGSFDFFGGLKNIGALRDQLRQSALDTAQLVRALQNPAVDLSALKTGAVAPKIDPTRIAYAGDSLGGIEGALSASIVPTVSTWTLNVAGAAVVLELAAHAPAISFQLTAAGGLNFGFNGDKFNESHPMVTVVQTIADPGDPISFAGFLVKAPQPLKGAVTKPRNILQVEVVYDELVSNESNEALARAGGWGLAVPNVGSNAGILDLKNIAANPGRVPLADVQPDGAGAIHDTPIPGVTAVVVQTSPSQHGYDMVRAKAKRSYAIPYGRYDTVTPFERLDTQDQFDITTSYRELQETMTRFMDDGFSGVVPRVSGFKPAVRDLDGDGTLDADDSAPSDPRKK